MGATTGRAPLRAFVRTESASAVVLVAAVAVALVWANTAPASYAAVWDTRVALRIGDAEFGQDLRTWVNSGLMTLFFLVVGPRGAARVRPRRPARAAPVRPAARGGRRRHGRAGRLIFLAVQRGPAERARVGHRDVHRHRARARPARDPRPERARPGARLRAHDLRRRRPGRAARHRRRLQRAASSRCRWRSPWRCSRCCWWWPGRCAAARSTSPSGSALWLGAGGERRRPGRRRAGHRAVRTGVHAEPRRAGGGDRARAAVPRAADARVGAGGHRRASPPRCRRTRGCRASTTRGRAS